MCDPHEEIPCALSRMAFNRAAFTGDARAAGLPDDLAGRLADNLEEHIAVQRRVATEVAALIRDAGEGTLNFTTPAFPDDIHDLNGLRHLADSFRLLGR